MALSNNTLLLIVILIITVIFFYLFFYRRNPDTFSSLGDQYEQIYEEELHDDQYQKELNKLICNNKYEQKIPEEIKIRNKFKSSNRAKNCEYKQSNYVDGIRGNDDMDEFDNFYEENNSLIKNSTLGENAEFSGIDETNDNLAQYQNSGKKTKISDVDLFNVDNFLPQQNNPNWFETVPDAIDVKNKHLINIFRPIGVDTVGSSHKNGSHDLRGDVPCPKNVISPWNQSTGEPDLNSKALC
jgi:uncharacterized protein YxeA